MTNFVSTHVVPVAGGGGDGDAAGELRIHAQWLWYSEVMLRSGHARRGVVSFNNVSCIPNADVVHAGGSRPSPYAPNGDCVVDDAVTQRQADPTP